MTETQIAPQICTFNRCSNNHTWTPKLALVNCSGCQTPVLAILMENCPICNEPSSNMQLRTDNTPKGPTSPAPIVAACKNVHGPAEIIYVELQREATYDAATAATNISSNLQVGTATYNEQTKQFEVPTPKS